MNSLFKVMPEHINKIEVRTFTKRVQSLHLKFFQLIGGGLAVVYRIIVLLQRCWFQLVSLTDGHIFSFRIFWSAAELMIPLIRTSLPGPEAATQAQTITLSPPLFYCWDVVIFFEKRHFFYGRWNETHTFPKVWFMSLHSTEDFLRSLGDLQYVFWLNWNEP